MGVYKFSKTLAKLASSSELLFAKSRNTRRVGKHLARLASGFVFLLVQSEFYSHLARRVVIRNPELREFLLYHYV
jgi:hypothetical protein